MEDTPAHRYWVDIESVRDLRHVLGALEDAYDSIAFLDSQLSEEESWYLRTLVRSEWTWPVSPRPDPYSRGIWRTEIRGFRLPEQTLTIASLALDSPGWLTVLGELSPLETIRRYLTDREERRRNRQYRDRLEEERGDLENESLRLENEQSRTRLMRERIEVMDSLGIPKSEQARILNLALIEPLDEVGQLQDRGLLSLYRPSEDDEGGDMSSDNRS